MNERGEPIYCEESNSGDIKGADSGAEKQSLGTWMRSVGRMLAGNYLLQADFDPQHPAAS